MRCFSQFTEGFLVQKSLTPKSRSEAPHLSQLSLAGPGPGRGPAEPSLEPGNRARTARHLPGHVFPSVTGQRFPATVAVRWGFSSLPGLHTRRPETSV